MILQIQGYLKKYYPNITIHSANEIPTKDGDKTVGFSYDIAFNYEGKTFSKIFQPGRSIEEQFEDALRVSELLIPKTYPDQE